PRGDARPSRVAFEGEARIVAEVEAVIRRDEQESSSGVRTERALYLVGFEEGASAFPLGEVTVRVAAVTSEAEQGEREEPATPRELCGTPSEQRVFEGEELGEEAGAAAGIAARKVEASVGDDDAKGDGAAEAHGALAALPPRAPRNDEPKKLEVGEIEG